MAKKSMSLILTTAFTVGLLWTSESRYITDYGGDVKTMQDMISPMRLSSVSLTVTFPLIP
jgi:hypothetical protein